MRTGPPLSSRIESVWLGRSGISVSWKVCQVPVGAAVQRSAPQPAPEVFPTRPRVRASCSGLSEKVTV